MDDPARPATPDVEQNGNVPVPAPGQVLLRTVPAAAVLTVGLPVLTYWGLDGNGNARGGWLPFAPALLMGLALLAQHLAQAPRPRLDQHADQKTLRRWIRFTSGSGRVPEDPCARTAAGALACGQLETAVLTLAALGGIIGIWFVRPETWWAVTAVLLMLIAVVPVLRARRSWRYLQALDAHERTG